MDDMLRKYLDTVASVAGRKNYADFTMDEYNKLLDIYREIGTELHLTSYNEGYGDGFNAGSEDGYSEGYFAGLETSREIRRGI